MMKQTVTTKKLTNIIVLIGLAALALIIGKFCRQGLTSSTTEIIINEICAKNATIIIEEDNTYSDYIELYNKSDNRIYLRNYGISDTEDEIKYIFGYNEYIEPKSYYLVFINDSNTGFSLCEGETVVLFFGKNEIDSFTIPENTIDVSYGRENHTGDIKKCAIGTPGYKNVYYNADELIFSKESGFYDDNFELEISCNSEGKILYTLDGSNPIENGIVYREPIPIDNISANDNLYASISNISLLPGSYIPSNPVDKAVVVRAVSVDENNNISKEKCSTYFVGYDCREEFDNTYVLSLVTDPKNLFDDNVGIYVTGNVWTENEETYELENYSSYMLAPTNYKMEGSEWERNATAELFGLNKQPSDFQDVGIRIHGGVSVGLTQKSFNIYARNNEKLFKNTCDFNSTSLILRNGGTADYRLTKFRDVLNQELVENRAIRTQRAIPCQVFIDGEYWGFYWIQERINEDFFADYYNIDIGNVLAFKFNSFICGDSSLSNELNDFYSWIENTDFSKDKNYKKLLSVMDVQSYLDYICFETIIANADSVDNNVCVWKSITKDESNDMADCRWRWAVYDTDASTSAFESATKADVNSLEETWYGGIGNNFMLKSLLKNEAIKEQFLITFMDILNTCFDPQNVIKNVDEYYSKYASAIILSNQRFWSYDYCLEDYEADVNAYKSFFIERPDYIIDYVMDYLNSNRF